MNAPTRTALELAEDLLAQRRFGEAQRYFSLHLKEHPSDVKTLLKSGICHLLNGAENAFLRIHDQVARMIAGVPHLPQDVARLWQQYQSLFAKVTAAALLLGATALPALGAEGDQRFSGHRYSGGVAVKPILVEAVVQVDQQGQLLLDQQPHTLQTLAEKLRSDARLRNGSVGITPEDETPAQVVGQVLEVCRSAGVKKLAVGPVGAEPILPIAKPAKDEVCVNVSANGDLQVDGRTCTAKELKSTLADRSQQGAMSVSVEAQPATPYKHVAAVLDVCAAAKVTKVGFVVIKPVTSSHKYSGGVFKPLTPVPPKP